MKRTLLFLLLFASGTALAEADTQGTLGQLKATLDDVRHEQQSVYQNYQMAKDQRLMEVQEGDPVMVQHPYGTSINTPPPNYDEVVRAQMEREQHIQQYTSDLKNLSARYLELEDRRKALLEQIRELEQQQGD